MKSFIAFLLTFGVITSALAQTDYSQLPYKDYVEHMVRNGAGVSLPLGWKLRVPWTDIKVNTAYLPSQYDKRDLLLYPIPVRRQRCGDCWAFSVLATFNYAWQFINQFEKPVIFAQQEMISRCPNTGGSCRGGWFRAYDYVVGKVGPGVPLAEDLPYRGSTTSCNKEVQKLPRGLTWTMIGSRDKEPTIDQMKAALMETPGILSVDLTAFSHSGPEVYTRCSRGSINHMTNIVGWKDDETVQGGGYWIMLNSWGENFGDKGFAKVAYLDKYGRKCSRLGEDTAVILKLKEDDPAQ